MEIPSFHPCPEEAYLDGSFVRQGRLALRPALIWIQPLPLIMLQSLSPWLATGLWEQAGTRGVTSTSGTCSRSCRSPRDWGCAQQHGEGRPDWSCSHLCSGLVYWQQIQNFRQASSFTRGALACHIARKRGCLYFLALRACLFGL